MLVITFTKKATAEIRQRIYEQLHLLANQEPGWRELATNLKRLTGSPDKINPEQPLSPRELQILVRANHLLNVRKDALQVMTIDAFTHSTFRNLICPVKGIDRFGVNSEAIKNRIPLLLEELLDKQLLARLQKLLSRRARPSLDKYQTLFSTVILQRFRAHLLSSRPVHVQPESFIDWFLREAAWDAQAKQQLKSFYDAFADLLQDYLLCADAKITANTKQRNTLGDYFKKDYLALFSPFDEFLDEPAAFLTGRFSEVRKQLELLKLMNKKTFWDGGRFKGEDDAQLKQNWQQQFEQARQQLADSLIFSVFLPEQAELLAIWKDVLKQYDLQSYRSKDFSFDDITWYCFEGLHSGHPPLFNAEDENTVNAFYEFLCRRTRFILIDEFQDTSIEQFNILRPLIEELLAGESAQPYGGFIAVGDEKQSIFGWRGGQRDLLLHLEDIFTSLQGCKMEGLKESWRSTPTLMQFINSVFAHPCLQSHLQQYQAEWSYQPVTGKNDHDEPVTHVRFKLQNYSKKGGAISYQEALQDFIDHMVNPEYRRSLTDNRSLAILARTNQELENIRIALANTGIKGEFQSNKTIFEHPIIAAILKLLRFAVHRDWLDWLAFLRSDLILLDSDSLKQVILMIRDYEQQVANGADTAIDLTSVPVAEAAYQLAQSLDTNEVYGSILKILTACNIPEKLTQPRDQVNLQSLLDNALAYEQAYQPEVSALQGFLRYCQDNETQDFFKQRDIPSRDAIQLLTIHKSKGLEFDTVFVWNELKSLKQDDETAFGCWVSYRGKQYHELTDIALTYHYRQVLKCSSFSYFIEQWQLQRNLEELNTMYVAYTRAKSRLYIYSLYENIKGVWVEYLDGKVKDSFVPTLFSVDATYAVMREQGHYREDGSFELTSSRLAAADEHKAAVHPEQAAHIFSPESLCHILPATDAGDTGFIARTSHVPLSRLKETYLTDKANLKGELAHFYLAQLRYATAEEIAQARILTCRQYGNLLPQDQLEAMINKLETLLPKLIALFHPAYDFIQTEYRIYDKGHEYRIDRLMVNTTAKTYRLVDYKTGEVDEAGQVEHYQTIIGRLLGQAFRAEAPPEYIAIDLDA